MELVISAIAASGALIGAWFSWRVYVNQIGRKLPRIYVQGISKFRENADFLEIFINIVNLDDVPWTIEKAMISRPKEARLSHPSMISDGAGGYSPNISKTDAKSLKRIITMHAQAGPRGSNRGDFFRESDRSGEWILIYLPNASGTIQIDMKIMARSLEGKPQKHVAKISRAFQIE